jgi:hypothetical protein
MMDKAVARMSRGSAWAANLIFRLAQHAESESVQLRASRALLAVGKSLTRYARLERRMANIEEALGVRVGSTSRPS